MKNAIFALKISAWIYIALGLALGVVVNEFCFLITLVAALPFYLAHKIRQRTKFGIVGTLSLFLLYVFSIFLPLGAWGIWSLWRDPEVWDDGNPIGDVNNKAGF